MVKLLDLIIYERMKEANIKAGWEAPEFKIYIAR